MEGTATGWRACRMDRSTLNACKGLDEPEEFGLVGYSHRVHLPTIVMDGCVPPCVCVPDRNTKGSVRRSGFDIGYVLLR